MLNKYLSYDATDPVSVPVCMGHRMLILVVLAALFAISEGQPSTCSIKVQDTWREAMLRCDFGRNMSVSQYDLLVQRFNESAIIETLVTCRWIGQEVTYHCILHNEDLVLYTNGSHLSQYLFLGLPLPPPPLTPWAQIEEEEEGFHYLCHAAGNLELPSWCEFPRIQPPAAPTLQLRKKTNNSIEVSWQADDDRGVLGYQLNYTQANVEDWYSIRLDPGNTTYTASGLLCGTLYRFVVRAFNYKGFSPESPVLEVKTNGSAPFLATGPALVKEINSTTVTLDFIGWETAGCPINFFSVKYCHRGDRTWNDVYNNIASDVTEMTVPELEPASRYMMVVTVHSEAGNVSFLFHFITGPKPPPQEPPAAPTLQLRKTTNNSIEVSWQADDDRGVLGYQLNYTQANVEDWYSIRLDPGNTKYTASGLLCGTLYRFVVRAFNYKGFFPESPVLEVKTNGSAPFLATGPALVKEINSTTVTLDFIGWETAGCPINFFSVKYCHRGDRTWNDVYNNIASDVREITVPELEPASRYMMVVTVHSEAGNVSSLFHFITGPKPPPQGVNQEDGERQGKQMTTAEIALIAVVVSGVCLAVFLGLFLRWRFSRTRRATQSNDLSVPLTDSSEAETPMVAADNSNLQPEH